MGVVVGRSAREVDEQGGAAIAGFTVVNDVSARDWQLHTSQWMPGKNLGSSTPVGPWIVTVDEMGPDPDLANSTRVDAGSTGRSDLGQDLHPGPDELLHQRLHHCTSPTKPASDSGWSAGGGEVRMPSQVPTTVSGYSRIAQLIAADRCVVLDGAIGTELIDVSGARPEVEEHLWGITAIIENPARVGTVHRRYVDAGCDVISTDTWGLPTAVREHQQLVMARRVRCTGWTSRDGGAVGAARCRGGGSRGRSRGRLQHQR